MQTLAGPVTVSEVSMSPYLLGLVGHVLPMPSVSIDFYGLSLPSFAGLPYLLREGLHRDLQFRLLATFLAMAFLMTTGQGTNL